MARDDDEPARASVAEARAALSRLGQIENETERMLEAAAIIEEQLGAAGVSSTVVGGLAVAYWTSARYVTGDIDVLMPSVPEAYEVLDALGFRRSGRVWLLDNPEIVFEAPGSVPDSGDESDEIETPQGRKLTMLKVEDMALWRLREAVFWAARDAIQQTLWLLEAPLLDRARLELRARTEHLDGPLRVLEDAATAQATAGAPFTDDGLRELVAGMKRRYPFPT